MFLASPLWGAQERIAWNEGTPLPVSQGLSGTLVAELADGSLWVAGGANFPNGLPWEGGQKFWHDAIYQLEEANGVWRRVGSLPQTLANGAVFAYGQELWLLGGCNGSGATNRVWRGSPENGEWTWSVGQPLPRPSAFHATAVVGGPVYLLPGGTELEGLENLTAEFWSLNFQDPNATWQQETIFPGSPRAKAAMVAQKLGDGRTALFVFGGEVPTTESAVLGAGILQDAWRFLPDSGWRDLLDLPAPRAAASALAVGASQVLLFPGEDGTLRGTDPATHPGYPAEIFSFHSITETWATVGNHPRPGVATSALDWRGRLTFVSGETHPGVCTPALTQATLLPPHPALGWMDWVVFGLYLFALVGMGAWFARRNKGSDDYFIAGQRIPWWAAGLSIYGTQLSAITFLATPALAFATDLRYAPTWLGILFVVPLVTKVFLPHFRRLDIRTAYEYLEYRFSRPVRQVGSASFVVMQTARMGIVVYLPALALSMVTGLDVRLCIAVTGVLATIYTVLGGMEAVVWTDVLQVFVLLGGVLLALVLAFQGAGGSAAFADSAAKAKLLLWDNGFSWTDAASWSLLLGAVILMIPPYTTDQAIVQRYLCAKDEKSAARAAWLNGWMSIPAGLLFPILGVCLWAFYRAQPESLHVGMENDAILPLFLGDHLPAGLAGLVIAGLFAATMSTLDSSMHSIATAVVNDFYRPARPNMDDQSILRLARGWTIGAGLLGTTGAVALASFDITSLFLLFLKVLGLFSSGLATLFLLGVFTKRVNGSSALFGAALGTAILAWAAWSTQLHAYWYGAVGIGIGLLGGMACHRFKSMTAEE